MINVVIADDQTLMRDGLKTILELEENINVVATTSDGLETIDLCEKFNIDIILMDVRMPRLNGVEATKVIKEKYPNIKILILTTFDDDEYIIDGLSNGATGYMLKDIEAEDLISAINNVYLGKYILPSNIALKLVKKLSQHKEVKIKNNTIFTERELEVAKMISEGFNNKQIASSLFISEGTVKNNVSNIYSKIGISDRTGAALYLKEILS